MTDLKALTTKRLNRALEPVVQKVLQDHLPNSEIFHAAKLVARASERFRDARQARIDFAGKELKERAELVNTERLTRKRLEQACQKLRDIMVKHGRIAPDEANRS